MAQLTRQMMTVRCVCVEHFSGFQITNMPTYTYGVLILYYTHRLLASTQHRTSPPPSRHQAVDIITFQCLNWYVVLQTATLNAVTAHITVHNFLHPQWKKIHSIQPLDKPQIGGASGTYGGQERCVHGFGGET
jgi:hypothetical protein